MVWGAKFFFLKKKVNLWGKLAIYKNGQTICQAHSQLLLPLSLISNFKMHYNFWKFLAERLTNAYNFHPPLHKQMLTMFIWIFSPNGKVNKIMQ
jgi:hypothetical protein